MDAAGRGQKALEANDYPAAIREYTSAILQNPKAVRYYLKRSAAYRRSSPADLPSALKDAEIGVKLAIQRQSRDITGDAQMERAIVLFQMERYGDAQLVFGIVRKKKEKAKGLDIWEAKTQNKIKALPEGDEKAKVTVTEDPDVAVPTESQLKKESASLVPSKAPTDNANGAAATAEAKPLGKIKHDWYQSNEAVTITILAKGVPKDSITVDIQENSISLSFPRTDGSTYDLTLDPLCHPIDPANSSYNVMSTKIELVLKKKAAFKWNSLEGDTSDSTTTAQPTSLLQTRENLKAPAYPTSSRSGPKNWDKIASELTTAKKHEEDGKDAHADEDEWKEEDDFEGGDPANEFFKKLYAGADPDTRRAMMKSYVESNGTALSTNWEDVSKGPVETTPPDGMEAKKYES